MNNVEELGQKFIDDKFPKSIGFNDHERNLLKSGYICGFNDSLKDKILDKQHTVSGCGRKLVYLGYYE